MKVLLVLMLLVFGNAVKAEGDYHEELFSPQENARIFKAVDFICGDIWCEGYYDYKFLSLSCDKKNNQCDLSFQFKESIDDHIVNFSPVQVCNIGEIYSIDQIMENDDSLKFSFIEKLSNCFDNLAEEFRGR